MMRSPGALRSHRRVTDFYHLLVGYCGFGALRYIRNGVLSDKLPLGFLAVPAGIEYLHVNGCWFLVLPLVPHGFRVICHGRCSPPAASSVTTSYKSRVMGLHGVGIFGVVAIALFRLFGNLIFSAATCKFAKSSGISAGEPQLRRPTPIGTTNEKARRCHASDPVRKYSPHLVQLLTTLVEVVSLRELSLPQFGVRIDLIDGG